ncbi:MAG: tryptophan--tRNA ligase [Saprospiraceae bacterium]|nr:tryptophan--tRNA ligase [Saprospiraceae bacterium]
MSAKRVLSGIQPTGDIHLGNYFGAVKNWVQLQDSYQCTYSVVDYHSMTMPYVPAQLRENTWSMVFQLLACGVDPKNLFIQSLVPEHTELAWVLGCITSFGELQRMTQFKDKSDQLKESNKESFVSTGLFFYPILQAADILIYHANFVPVGKDQEQHLELSRNIAARFNHQFCSEENPYFHHPEPLFTETPKILSLADPNKKMSKSLGEKHFINLFSDSEIIRKQVKTAVTDTGSVPSETMSPGVANLFELLKACGNQQAHASLLSDYHQQQLKYSQLKEAVADSIIALCAPIKEKYEALRSEEDNIKEQIRNSSGEIRKMAQKTMREVKELVGILNV